MWQIPPKPPELSTLSARRQVFAWVEQFCAKTKATGQLCFDFMLNKADGLLYAFECNPRTSTVLLEYHDHPLFAEALCNPQVPCAGLQCSTPSPLFTWWCHACVLHAPPSSPAAWKPCTCSPLPTISCTSASGMSSMILPRMAQKHSHMQRASAKWQHKEVHVCWRVASNILRQAAGLPVFEASRASLSM